MNIILPSFMYKNIFISNYQETSCGNERILFFEKDNKIIVMNETSTCIWQFIVDNIQKRSNDNITIDAILGHLHKCFDMEELCDEDILNDIIDIINEFIDANMISYCIDDTHL